MKKIAIVVQRFGEDILGGAERHAFILAKKLSKRFDVTVLSTCAKDYYSWKNEYSEGGCEVGGIKVIRFKTDFPRDKKAFDKLSAEIFEDFSNLELSEKWISAQGPYSSGLFEYLRENDGKYDAFVFMTYLYASTVLGMREVKKSKKYLIPTAHDEKPIYLPLYKDVFSGFDGLIFNTEAEKSFVSSLFPDINVPGIVMGISVEAPEVLDLPKNNEKIISYIGRIDESKGLNELFDYFSKLPDDLPFKLVLAGEKHLKIPKNVNYLGKISEEEKYQLIAKSEIVIVPSKFESLSLLLLEAFSQKKPVLVNGKCEVLKEHCLKSDGGLWYDDFEDFEECLRFFSENSDVARKMGEKGFKYFKKNYHFEVLINKFTDFIYGNK